MLLLRGQVVTNRLIASLKPQDLSVLEPFLDPVLLSRGEVLFEPGDDVVATYFPAAGTMASLVVPMADGRAVEAASIGREGAVGGIVSAGNKPAFARAVVQMPGTALRIEAARLDEAKDRSKTLRDLFARYADALLAQVLQSVACNALHTIEQRYGRWLLMTQDRVGGSELELTQEFLSEMLGVQRTTVTAAARTLQDRGVIQYRRGRITILDRPRLERLSCECHETVRRHYDRVMPAVPALALTEPEVTTDLG
ncbi:MAG TPA: Crp/Fnr family transcriptional regulator [Salinarimonas sp.]|nr:Crp/Fnr family transcriptional regulator [Salinarimonas sp.]